MLYHLSVFNDFAPFLEGNWSPQTVANRGFIGFPPDIRGGKAAVRKRSFLREFWVLLLNLHRSFYVMRS